MTHAYIVKSDNHSAYVEAHDHEEAAEKFGELQDEQGDYTIIGGRNEKVSVEHVLDGSVQHFIVSADSTIVYYAQRTTGR